MVSVSVNGMPVPEWTPAAHMLAERVAVRVLDGVGLPATDDVQMGMITRVVRRQCTDDERRRVVEKYLQT
jgi:hypothetical protein